MLSLLLALAAFAQAAVIEYPIKKETLPNGLDLLVIEMPEFKGVLSYNTLVLAGSGREEERGKTGLAHLFEHILFRHGEGKYDDAINKMGAHNNAWTWFDVTYYHPLTFTANLDELIRLESERFKALSFTDKTFKTEAGAVLGEYRRGAARPGQKLDERLVELLHGETGYGHTTIGYFDDVVAMPQAASSARRFYEDFYRPNNCAVIVAGDVKAQELLPKLRAAYGDWKAKPVPPLKKKAPALKGPLREHIGWDADVAPLLWVAYSMPAFKPGTAGGAAAQLLAELLVSPAAPLYKKLRYEKQTVSALGFDEGSAGFESAEPRHLIAGAQLFKEKLAEKGTAYFDEVSADIVAGFDELKSFSKAPGAAALLETVKSKYRNDFLAALINPEKVASSLAWYYRFDRDPKALDAALAAVDALKPEDIDAFAARQFVPANRVVLTLARKEAAAR